MENVKLTSQGRPRCPQLSDTVLTGSFIVAASDNGDGVPMEKSTGGHRCGNSHRFLQLLTGSACGKKCWGIHTGPLTYLTNCTSKPETNVRTRVINDSNRELIREKDPPFENKVT